MQKKNIERGDIFYLDFGNREGSVQSGARPVVVVQDDLFNRNAPTVIVACVTAVIKKRYLPSHIYLGEEYGLKKPSIVLLEQIQTVNKDDLTDYIGHIDDKKTMKLINSSLKKTFGMWFYKKVDERNVRCLCPACLNSYLNSGSYIVRRKDIFAKEKDKCDLCDRPGWDYEITERSHK